MSFIVLDGPDGGGKSTQAARLARALEEAGRRVTLARDPGGTPIGEEIRRVLLDPGRGEMAPDTELFLYLASRAQLVAEVIQPALKRGEVVIGDRFQASTLVYQGLARGGGDQAAVAALVRAASGGLEPAVTVILDLEAAAGLGRRPGRDRMEAKGLEFHRRVRQGFLDLARATPDRYRVVDAAATEEEVARAIQAAVAHVL